MPGTLISTKEKKQTQTNSLCHGIFDILVHKSQVMVDLGLEWKQTQVRAQLLLCSLAESHRALGGGVVPSAIPGLQARTHQCKNPKESIPGFSLVHQSPVVGAGLGPSGPHRAAKLLSWAGQGNQLRLQPGQRIEQLGLSPTHCPCSCLGAPGLPFPGEEEPGQHPRRLCHLLLPPPVPALPCC